VTRETIQYLSPDVLECEAQVRGAFQERETLGLARSVQEVGVQQPIRARRDGERLVVVVGGRRVLAARLAKLREVPVIIEEKPLCEGEVLHRQLVENMQRVELLPLERANGLKRLIELTGWSTKDAAAKCGLSAATATKLLSILNLPQEVQRRVDAGEIPWSSAYELSRIGDTQTQSELATRVIEGELTRDGLSEAARPESAHGSRPTAGKSNRVTLVTADGHIVSVAGKDLTVEHIAVATEELLRKARRAQRRGLDIQGFAASLRDGARPHTK
jgi:ParB family transcriptional regulator, chromosome partitioning protein